MTSWVLACRPFCFFLQPFCFPNPRDASTAGGEDTRKLWRCAVVVTMFQHVSKTALLTINVIFLTGFSYQNTSAIHVHRLKIFFLEKVRIFLHILILCEWIMVSLYKFWSHCICPHLYFYLQLDLCVLVTCTCIWNCMKMYFLLAFPSLVFLVLSPEWKGWAIRQTVKVVPSQGTPPQWPTVTRRGESRISNVSISKKLENRKVK